MAKEEKIRFGKLALDREMINQKQLEDALKELQQNKLSLSETLVHQGYITTEQSKTLQKALKEEGQLGDYKLLQKLGEGGMGCVYKALHTVSGQVRAVKVLNSQLSRDNEFVQRFLREARASITLSHPHVVRSFEARKSGPTYYLAMEFVEGISLKDYILRKGSLSELEALRICKMVASALGAAYQKGITHRDIKPENILMDLNTGDAKLADFGLVRLKGTTTLTQTGAFMGTPAYISPEQAMREKDIDIRSDIYSLGITLFHMLTGSLPFGGTNPLSVCHQQIHEPLPSPLEHKENLSPAVVALLEIMTAKSPKDRPQDPREVLLVIQSILKGNTEKIFTISDGFSRDKEQDRPSFPSWLKVVLPVLGSLLLIFLLVIIFGKNNNQNNNQNQIRKKLARCLSNEEFEEAKNLALGNPSLKISASEIAKFQNLMENFQKSLKKKRGKVALKLLEKLSHFSASPFRQELRELIRKKFLLFRKKFLAHPGISKKKDLSKKWLQLALLLDFDFSQSQSPFGETLEDLRRWQRDLNQISTLQDDYVKLVQQAKFKGGLPPGQDLSEFRKISKKLDDLSERLKQEGNKKFFQSLKGRIPFLSTEGKNQWDEFRQAFVDKNFVLARDLARKIFEGRPVLNGLIEQRENQYLEGLAKRIPEKWHQIWADYNGGKNWPELADRVRELSCLLPRLLSKSQHKKRFQDQWDSMNSFQNISQGLVAFFQLASLFESSSRLFECPFPKIQLLFRAFQKDKQEMLHLLDGKAFGENLSLLKEFRYLELLFKIEANRAKSNFANTVQLAKSLKGNVEVQQSVLYTHTANTLINRIGLYGYITWAKTADVFALYRKRYYEYYQKLVDQNETRLAEIMALLLWQELYPYFLTRGRREHLEKLDRWLDQKLQNPAKVPNFPLSQLHTFTKPAQALLDDSFSFWTIVLPQGFDFLHGNLWRYRSLVKVLVFRGKGRNLWPFLRMDNMLTQSCSLHPSNFFKLKNYRRVTRPIAALFIENPQSNLKLVSLIKGPVGWSCQLKFPRDSCYFLIYRGNLTYSSKGIEASAERYNLPIEHVIPGRFQSLDFLFNLHPRARVEIQLENQFLHIERKDKTILYWRGDGSKKSFFLRGQLTVKMAYGHGKWDVVFQNQNKENLASLTWFHTNYPNFQRTSTVRVKLQNTLWISLAERGKFEARTVKRRRR